MSNENEILKPLQEASNLPFPPILKQIIKNAERNVLALPHGERHSEVLKKFSTALFIYAGPLAYEFLQKNLHQALPSLRTVQRTVHARYKAINEGEFCFDGLVSHIAQYNTVSVVSIGEDATRIICRVEYDVRTDRCVGFVLPLKNGLPVLDSFLATSFDAIENMFATQTPARYAYIYMAQPLDQNIPAFCLACFGTNNKFTAEHVLLRWQHIYKECERRKINVISFSGDGDPHVMKAMRVSTGLLSDKVQVQRDVLVPRLSYPASWCSWFWMDQPSRIAYVQDIVHIAVKLKCRLLKPSIILPMGSYVAGVHHLRIVKGGAPEGGGAPERGDPPEGGVGDAPDHSSSTCRRLGDRGF